MQTESSPLLSPKSQQSKYYFLNKQDESYQGGTTSAVKDGDGVAVVEGAPRGSNEDEFAPRMVVHKKHPSQVTREHYNGNTTSATSKDVVGNFFSNFFGTKNTTPSSNSVRKYGEIGTISKPRKAPVKIEPKVFFANERTFLAWLHVSIILAGASIAIVSLADTDDMYGQLYGIILLPVAISFIVYSMYQYSRRAWLIRHRLPGPYEDTIGPAILGIMLMLSIVAEFGLKLYSISQHY